MRYSSLLLLTVVCASARAEVEIYIGLGELTIPVDGVSATQEIEAGQFFRSFNGKRFYFRVRDGYVSELVGLGTPGNASSSSSAVAVLAEATAVSGDTSIAGESKDATPDVLGPFDIAGIYAYEVDTGIDRGMDCENATMKRLGARTFEFICPQTMSL